MIFMGDLMHICFYLHIHSQQNQTECVKTKAAPVYVDNINRICVQVPFKIRTHKCNEFVSAEHTEGHKLQFILPPAGKKLTEKNRRQLKQCCNNSRARMNLVIRINTKLLHWIKNGNVSNTKREHPNSHKTNR